LPSNNLKISSDFWWADEEKCKIWSYPASISIISIDPLCKNVIARKVINSDNFPVFQKLKYFRSSFIASRYKNMINNECIKG